GSRTPKRRNGPRRSGRWSDTRARAPRSSSLPRSALSWAPTPAPARSGSSGSRTTTAPIPRLDVVPRAFAGEEAPAGWPRLPGTPRPESLERPLSTLTGVGPALEKRLAKLRLRTVRDLLEHRPHRYETAVPERRIADLLAGEEAAIAGEVRRVSVRRPRRNLAIVQARVADESGEIGAVWFNQAWLAERLQPGTRVRLRGQLERNGFKVRSYDLNGVSATADFAPVYPASEEVTPKRLRGLVELALDYARDLPDPLPAELKAAEELPLLPDALVALHRPRSLEEGEEARRRLAFDELLVLQVGLARARAGREQARARPLGAPGDLSARYRELLPFELTPDQEQAIAEIDRDLAGEAPMQRLLQGDVGSGKTVVALYALVRAVEAGFAGALRAPTSASSASPWWTSSTASASSSAVRSRKAGRRTCST